MSKKRLTIEDYRSLAEFRSQLRSYVKFGERLARESNLAPRQYEMLVALKGLSSELRPRMSQLAERLQIQHHRVAELADRMEEVGLVRRKRDNSDRRVVLLLLTAAGEKIIRELVVAHRKELSSRGPSLVQSLQRALSSSGGKAER